MKDPHEIILSIADAAWLGALKRSDLALLGRRPGSVVMSTLPNGWPFTVRILEARRAREEEPI
jgi:hypothetical protein